MEGDNLEVTNRTSLANILTFVFGLYLILFSLFSFISFNNFIQKGRFDFQYFHIPCGPAFVIAFTVIIWILNLYNAFIEYNNTKLKMDLNIFYIFLIYPGIILFLIFAGFVESLQNIMVFAFPIFFIGAFLLPACSHIIYSEAP
jgi:hypothetical protein